MSHRVTLALGVIAFIGMGIAFLDGRHASAGDVTSLTKMIQEDRIEDLEFRIAETERDIRRILLTPEARRSDWQIQALNDLENLKERYLRKLERLLGTW